ncbi:tRNA (adenosine(37)-N6)-threonylcarbamoyltransferase complex dimerization subunit type 1 TsaB [Plebeiibacterium sediminum]|uniref:tRNA (Adenosine(37)-N6)-threonylcarbamoyltransferase complex dimerization subunit type 1 TsaB n=1 Tax=Plebeiibacterium sediminum TaxID=2992112 RepID=A0AAE3M7H7_9BACT|nr:tRNA (adenosine(37)-N6)-threonylcarbamoyltransferase complex dimerization subunit type 1 TsaB [Plebeiobacterium sediminum]MCW3788437.1 tRNA (adenosine(37)-N6)-threonylcarbamoyltransferase complex dimerization subunit type 1 TsaB [Plebeiobacterium sediminum]
MALILSIETSTKVCSVCLSENDNIIIKKELFEANSHATHLTVFIQDLFNDIKDYQISDIDAVAVSSGPGSYTGLRIGVSVAKGICYALNKPLIAITSLEALAYAAIDNENLKEDTLICPMIDARRMEVYTTLYNAKLEKVKEISAEIIDENSFAEALQQHPIIFLGDGAAKCQDVIKGENAIFIENKAPLAANMVKTAYQKFQDKQFEDVAYFEPFYLKDFVATTPKNKVL